MLTIYRRHVKSCPHRTEGRKYRRCRCPIWADGSLNDVEIRESLQLRDWEKAQQRIREWEAEGMPTVSTPEMSIEDGCNAYLNDAAARRLEESTLKKYRVLFKQLNAFASNQGLIFLKQCTLTLMRRFRESWADGALAGGRKLERLQAFFRFAERNRWIDENPVKGIQKPRVTDAPTLPFNRDEMVSIIAACGRLPDNYGRTDSATAKRARALVLLLRYSGMRIGDAVTCPVDRLVGDRLFLYTQKTGVPVVVKLPPFVVDALNTMPKVSDGYFFWTGEGSAETVAGNWRRSLRRAFCLAGIKGGHPHRFRHTFAVELLQSSIPSDRVAILLGHSSSKVTEKHYSPWVAARQEQLEADVERSWAKDPVVLAETKGTYEVHENREVVN